MAGFLFGNNHFLVAVSAETIDNKAYLEHLLLPIFQRIHFESKSQLSNFLHNFNFVVNAMPKVDLKTDLQATLYQIVDF